MQMTILECIQKYLNSVKLSRSANTFRTYANAMNLFTAVLKENGIEVESAEVTSLPEDAVIWILSALKDFSSATEQVYITAVVGLFEFIAGENLAQVNLPRIRLLIKQRARRPGIRLPQFPKNAIDVVLDYASGLVSTPTEQEADRLIKIGRAHV